MKATNLVLIALAACARPHVDPQPRQAYEQALTVVKVKSSCDGDVREGTGVIVSERYVLTAQHVVRCAYIPVVWVTTRGGEVRRMVVDKESESEDIARLELLAAQNFGLDVPPPLLAPGDIIPNVNDWVCVYPYGKSECYVRIDRDLIAGRRVHGDSGAPVYDGGLLLGIVIRDVPSLNATRISLISPKWLEGT